MVFFAGLACPAVDAMEGKPDGVDVDERQQNDDEPDEHAEATEVAVSQSGGGQGDEDLEQAAPKGLFGVEMPEDDIAGSEKDGHEEEADEHGGSVKENRMEAALWSRSCFASRTYEPGKVSQVLINDIRGNLDSSTWTVCKSGLESDIRLVCGAASFAKEKAPQACRDQ